MYVKTGSFLLDGGQIRDGFGPNYDVEVRPGALEVVQDRAERSWVKTVDVEGDEIDEGSWTNRPVLLVPSGASGGAGVYDLIEAEGSEDGFSDGLVVDNEGEVVHDVRLGVGSGESAGAFSSTVSVTTRIDATAPALEVALEGDGSDGAPVRAVVRAVDEAAERANASSGIDRIELVLYDRETGEAVDEAATADDRLELEVDEAGSYRLTAVARDRAGNASPVAEQTFDIEAAGDGTGSEKGDEAGEPDGDGQAPGGEDGADGTVPGNEEHAPETSPEEDGEAPAEGGSSPDGEDGRAEQGDGGGDLAQTSDPSLPALIAAGAGSVAAIALGLLLRGRNRA